MSSRPVVLAIALTGLAACSPSDSLKPFSSDGCSLFPDVSLINEDDWCACCFEHDIAYWRGGTQAEREQADDALRSCVLAKTGDAALAKLMYEGVRLGGSPYFYNWYRWGYGWGFDRKYQALTGAEVDAADALLQSYFDAPQPSVCGEAGGPIPLAQYLVE